MALRETGLNDTSITLGDTRGRQAPLKPAQLVMCQMLEHRQPA
jgi:hypothetical protein